VEIALYSGLLLTAISYFICGGLVFNSKARGTVRSMFICTYLSMVLWSVGYLFAGASLSPDPFILWPFLETVQVVVWTLLLLAIIDSRLSRLSQFLKNKYVIFLIICAITLNLTLNFTYLSPIDKFKLMVSAALLGSIIQLILLEQIYRNADEDKWAYKPLILGLASLNIFHMIMMSNALLLNQVDPLYLASRPYIYVLITPLLILSMKRVESWNLRVFISREVVLHSSLLVFAGVYLMVMALTGYFIQQTGQAWSGVLQIVFVAGALIALAYIFVSESIRKNFKTFIQKHFYANQYDYREEWLSLTSILDRSTADDDFYAIGLTGLCNSLHYQKGVYCKIQNGTIDVVTDDPFGLSLEAKYELLALTEKIQENRWVIDISEFGSREYAEEFRGYSIAHLTTHEVEIAMPIFIDDELHGFFVLSSEGSERVKLNWEVRDYLTAISSQIGSYIRFCEARVKLEENAKFAAFNRMSAFVVHDLKNVIAQIGMIVSNGEKFRDNPEFIDDTFETLGHTKDRMDRMLAQLKDKQQQRSLSSETDINQALVQLSEEFKRNWPQPTFESHPHPVHLQVDKERLHSVVGHLIENAQHATDDSGFVKVDLQPLENACKIIISDSGIGMTDDFMNNLLFKPFETTKGNAGMGVGVYEAKTFAEEMGGSLTVQSKVGQGSTFVMTLPLRKNSG